jgi:hypothetical protein
LLIENLALRQQLAVFKRQHSRPRLTPSDKIFWVLLRRFWSSWKAALIVGNSRNCGPLAPRRVSALLAVPLPHA